jgi:hypothetical protein
MSTSGLKMRISPHDRYEGALMISEFPQELKSLLTVEELFDHLSDVVET